jgi:hypothetical protein
MRLTAIARRLATSRRFTLLAAAAAAAAAVAVPAASAGPLASTAAPCSSQTFSTPFTPWLDWNTYTLAPSGSLDTKTASSDWTLSGGASIDAGNEPFYVNSKNDKYALSLPSGSSATTRAMCVTVFYPTIRFFVQNAGAVTSTLKVEVLFEDLFGGVHSLFLGNLVAGAAWKPTLPIAFLANALGSANYGGTTPVAFRFTPQGAGSGWRIDDVEVDPYKGY